MPNIAVEIASLWINRRNRDTEVRQHARALVNHLTPAAVITGGSRGIGLAFARVFIGEGHTVLLVARNSDALANAAKALQPTGTGRVFTLVCDVTSGDAIANIETALTQSGCYLDILINNAAMGASGPFAEASLEDLETLMALNIAALTRLTRHATTGMIARGRGGILNIASLGGVVPGPYQAAYYASKAYVMSLTEALAAELSGRGVRISVVAPGPVETRFHAAMGADRALYRTLLPGLTPDHVARRSFYWFMLGQRVIVPGLLYQFFYVTLRVMPHPLSVLLTGWLLKNPPRGP